MTVMGNGFIQIGNVMTQASQDVISKLKSILDQHGIFYIVDGVLFNPPHANGTSWEVSLKGGTKEVDHLQNDLSPDAQFLIDLENYQEFIVPDLYALNFMSLINLDSDEADFLSTLVYGEHPENEYQFGSQRSSLDHHRM
jgi:hypothetical protein